MESDIKTTPTAAQVVQQGLALHQKGRVLDAAPFYRQLLTTQEPT